MCLSVERSPMPRHGARSKRCEDDAKIAVSPQPCSTQEPSRPVSDRVYMVLIWFGVFPAHYRAFHDTDEPDETSFRALRPKTLRLTLEITETVTTLQAVTRRVRERYLAICCTTVSSEARPRFVRFRGRFEDRRFAGPTFRRGGCVIFGIFHTELDVLHWSPDRPRPGPPTYDPDLPAADRRAAAEARRVDFV